VLARDRELFARHREARARFEQAQQAAQALVDESAAARRESLIREDAARRTLVQRQNLAALLRSRADGESRAAQELREAARRLEEAIARLPATGGAGGGLQPGQMAWPVRGRVRQPFGRQRDREFGTETLRQGVEIAAEPGTPVRAVAPGRVLFADWFRGYGQMLIVDHGAGDLTVLAYLGQLAVEKGQMIRAGQEIGTVGEAGPVSGPGLYFEIRRGGRAVDPEPWLGP
jgi:septal ring factor EnvC (AmiA/AmiB activator)